MRLATIERWKVGTAMNMPPCVREYGMPDVVDVLNHTCGTVHYPTADWKYVGDYNSSTRVTFTYRWRAEKIVTECGSITARLPLTENDLWLLDRSAMARGGKP